MDTQTFVDYYRRQLEVQKQQLLGKEKGEKIGLEKGEKIGLEKGEKIGLEKGEKKGARKQQEETAKKMYSAGFGIDDISRFVSLSADELKKILE